MSTFTVEGTEEGGFLPPPTATPDAVLAIGQIPSDLGTREDVEAEVDLMALMIRGFCTMEPDEALMSIGALSARCTELCVQLVRVEGRERSYRQLRTQQVQRVLDELERQHKIHSRLLEARRQDLQVLTGRR